MDTDTKSKRELENESRLKIYIKFGSQPFFMKQKVHESVSEED